MSPILFSVFLNDLSQFMSTQFETLLCQWPPLIVLVMMIVIVYLRIVLLLYADDTVLLAVSQV